MEEPAGLLPATDQRDVFFTALRGLHTEPHLASDAKQTVNILKEIMEASNTKFAVTAGLPSAPRLLVESALKGVKHATVEELSPGETVETISKADLGITWIQFAAARSGALVEVAYDDAIKLASCLPRVHIALLSSRTLLPDLDAAIMRIGGLLKSSSSSDDENVQKRKKPVVSIISGPSKTADIELRLIYGVHGPHALHVVMLDWV